MYRRYNEPAVDEQEREIQEIVTLTLIKTDDNLEDEVINRVWDTLKKQRNQSHFEQSDGEEVSLTATSADWKYYHADTLAFSLAPANRTIVFQLEVEHPRSGKKFKVYYSKGETQFCDNLTDKFDETLLV